MEDFNKDIMEGATEVVETVVESVPCKNGGVVGAIVGGVVVAGAVIGGIAFGARKKIAAWSEARDVRRMEKRGYTVFKASTKHDEEEAE